MSVSGDNQPAVDAFLARMEARCTANLRARWEGMPWWWRAARRVQAACREARARIVRAWRCLWADATD